MISIKGEQQRCECGANVFTKITKERIKCNDDWDSMVERGVDKFEIEESEINVITLKRADSKIIKQQTAK